MPSAIGRRLATALAGLATPRRGYRRIADLSYGPHPRQKLDLYLPQNQAAPSPVLLFFYGGSWQSGEKGWYRALGAMLARNGLAAAIADYRLYPAVRYPAFLEDAALALRWTRTHIGTYGADRTRLFLMGHSAGAYNAVMLACDETHLRRAGADPAWISGVIGICGPYDFLPLKDPALIDIFGGDRRTDSQPIHRATAKTVPMLLVTGTPDRTVSARNTKTLAAKLTALGSDVTARFYPGLGHIAILVSLLWPFARPSTLREDILSFVRG